MAVRQAAWSTRLRSSSNPARPYMVRLIVFSRLICPSTGPVDHRVSSAARRAARSFPRPSAKPASGVPAAAASHPSSVPVPFFRTKAAKLRARLPASARAGASANSLSRNARSGPGNSLGSAWIRRVTRAVEGGFQPSVAAAGVGSSASGAARRRRVAHARTVDRPPSRPSAGPSEALCEAAEIASGPDAPAHLCSRAERRGARPARSGPARVGRVHRAPGADRAGERGRAPAADDRARAALRRADGPQRRPRLQRRRPRGPDGRLVAAEERRPGPGRGRAGAAPGDPAPAAARLRPRQEHLDPRPPGAGGARAGAEPDRALGGDGPAGAAAAGGRVEAGQALADQPRPRLRAKKRRRDRLIRLARGRPGWAFGFADEVWFSRFAQPALHAWTAGE